MRVLYLHHGYGAEIAGAEQMAHLTARAVARLGHDVLLLQSLPAESRAIRPDGDVPVVVWRDLAAPTEIPQRLGGIPDVIHLVDLVHAEFNGLARALAARFERPLVVTPASAPEFWEDADRARDLCRDASAVLVMSPAESGRMEDAGVERARIMDLRAAGRLHGHPDPEGFCRRHGIEAPFVLFLGRKIVSKGYVLLLAAMQEVWRSQPTMHFVFIGPRIDPGAGGLFARHADPRLTEMGIVDENTKHSALAACALLCLPSTADVFPMVLVEAWHCGKPTVTCAFDGARYLVRHGVDGEIVSPQPASIAKAIVRLVSDPRRLAEMGAAAKKRARRKFGWDRTARDVLACYERIAIR